MTKLGAIASTVLQLSKSENRHSNTFILPAQIRGENASLNVDSSLRNKMKYLIYFRERERERDPRQIQRKTDRQKGGEREGDRERQKRDKYYWMGHSIQFRTLPNLVPDECQIITCTCIVIGHI